MTNHSGSFRMAVAVLLTVALWLPTLSGAGEINVITTRTAVPGVPLERAQVAPILCAPAVGETKAAPLPAWELGRAGYPALGADADATGLPGGTPEFASGPLPPERVGSIDKEPFGGEPGQVSDDEESKPTEGAFSLIVPLGGNEQQNLAPSNPYLISSGTVNSVIPDQGWHWRRVIWSGDPLPANATVTNLEYRMRIDDQGDPLEFYCGDYEIHLFTGEAARELMIYDNLGGRTDGGFDDDAEDDSDIYLNWRNTHFFDGEDASQWFGVWIDDVYASDEGILNYIEFYVHWEVPLPNLSCYTPAGWDGPVVASSVPGTNTYGPDLRAGEDTYIDFAVGCYDADATETFYTYLYLDGEYVQGWYTAGLPAGYYAYVQDYTHVFDEGTQTLCVTHDANNDVAESDEGDNECCQAFTWAEQAVPVYVDIDPGRCPNRCRAGSPLMMTVAILGTADFDVTSIDISSLGLRREGTAGEVAPRRQSLGDVETPYTADACGCHKIGPDGFTDLCLKFQMGEVSAALGLDGLPTGTVARLILEGNLTDGRPVFGSDCVFAVNGLWQEPLLGDDIGFLSASDGKVDRSGAADLSFQVSQQGRVVLDIYDARGRKVATLLNQGVSAGVHSITWEGVNAGGNRLSSGVYFASLRTDRGGDMKKVVIVR